MKTHRLHIFLLLLGLYTHSFAQYSCTTDTCEWDVLNLDEVVITGTRVPKLLKDTPVQTTLLTSKDIERSDATDIQGLLQSELPGVEFSYAMNQQVHLNFGGFGGQSILFLIDGERMAGETLDDVDFSRIDMNNIDRIEIVRGASSALYGSNAGGGVINIITKGASKKCDLDLDVRFGRHADRRYMLSVGSNFTHIQNSFSVTASRMSNYSVHNAPGAEAAVVSTIFGHKTLNVREKLVWKPFDGLKLSGRGGFYMRELPREIEAPDRYRAYNGGVKGEWKIGTEDYLELSYSFDQYDKSQYNGLSGLDIRNYSNVQNSVRTLYNHSFINGSILTAGADYMHDYLMNTKLAGTKKAQDCADLFMQVDWMGSNKWEVVGALRYDYFSDGRMSRVTPKISARYKPVVNLNIRAAYGMGFRAPTLKEKYYEFDMAGIWIVRGNPDLKPETGHNINFSADYTVRQYNITATAYYNHIKNKITTGLPYYLPDTTTQLYLNYENLADYNSCGVEITAQAAWRNGISAKLSYAFTYEKNVRNKEDKEANNQFMPARPHSLTARVGWDKSFSENYSITIDLNGRFLSAVFNKEYVDFYDLSKGTVIIKYPGYTLWKLSVSQKIFGKVRLTIALDNLFNYRPRYYYLNAPLTDGINLLVGASVTI
ncbi:MAG: TonB-dependent receptor [Muribaculaceae bacterium]|nr:TonB-dependent receptor [Muribaculaceae bacterium]